MCYACAMAGRTLEHHAGRLLGDDALRRVERAVAEAEARTSAELKVVVVRHCWDQLDRKAAQLFHKHGLDRTQQRNAVMILVVTANHELLIHGDTAIHERVGEAFWREARDAMLEKFRDGQLAEGLIRGVALIGDALVQHFPRTGDDVNELPDEVVHDD